MKLFNSGHFKPQIFLLMYEKYEIVLYTLGLKYLIDRFVSPQRKYPHCIHLCALPDTLSYALKDHSHLKLNLRNKVADTSI